MVTPCQAIRSCSGLFPIQKSVLRKKQSLSSSSFFRSKVSSHQIFRSTFFTKSEASSIKKVLLPKKLSYILKEELKQLPLSPYKIEEFDSFLSFSKEIVAQNLPDSFLEIKEMLINNQLGGIEITNLLIDDDLPPTPKKGGNLEEGSKTTFIAEGLLIGLSSFMTECNPFNFRQELVDGEPSMIHNIVPIRSFGDKQSNMGFKNNFFFHKENAHHHMTPTFLALKGVRADYDRKALTMVVCLKEVIKHLSCKDIENLQKPLFTFYPAPLHREMSEKYGVHLGTETSLKAPVLTYDSKGELSSICISFNGVDIEDGEAMISLKILEGLLYKYSKKIVLDQSNMVLINNRLSTHTRTGYHPKFGDFERWIIRCHLSDKLWAKRSVTPEAISKDLQIGVSQSRQILEHMKLLGMINQENELTSQFTKREQEFRKRRLTEEKVQSSDASFFLDLPEPFQSKQEALINSLLKHGPVYPSRIV